MPIESRFVGRREFLPRALLSGSDLCSKDLQWHISCFVHHQRAVVRAPAQSRETLQFGKGAWRAVIEREKHNLPVQTGSGYGSTVWRDHDRIITEAGILRRDCAR
jgi:hypothetical protein